MNASNLEVILDDGTTHLDFQGVMNLFEHIIDMIEGLEDDIEELREVKDDKE